MGRQSVAYSKLIAGLVGPVLAAMGIAMLVNHSRFPDMIGQLAQNQGLIFLSGILSLLGGLAIVRVHNVWTGGWRVILTVLGWLAIAGGLLRMWLPHMAAPIATTFAGSSSALMIGGLIVLVLGAFLTYASFGPDTERT
jgi:hypothetical protein